MEWKKLKAEYVAGGTSYRKLAEKYEIKFSTLKNVAVKEGWAELREQVKNKTTTVLVENVSKRNAKIDDKYFSLVDQVLDKAGEVIDSIPEWEISDLKDMAMALKYLKECKGVKSEADMREQEARIDKLRREAEKDEGDKDTTVKITIEGGLDDWQS